MSTGDLSNFFLDLFLQEFVVLLVEVIHILVKFTPRYLIFFDASVNGIVSIYSFSVCLLLVYRKANVFCKLILYLLPCYSCLWCLRVLG
jgi:hypothetical protein